MNSKGLINAAKTAADHAAKKAARDAGPAPIPTEPTDPNAAFVELVNQYNAAEMECHRLLGAVVAAILKRRGDRIRIGEGGQLLNQTIGNPGEWDAGRRARVLIVEALGTPI